MTNRWALQIDSDCNEIKTLTSKKFKILLSVIEMAKNIYKQRLPQVFTIHSQKYQSLRLKSSAKLLVMFEASTN